MRPRRGDLRELLPGSPTGDLRRRLYQGRDRLRMDAGWKRTLCQQTGRRVVRARAVGWACTCPKPMVFGTLYSSAKDYPGCYAEWKGHDRGLSGLCLSIIRRSGGDGNLHLPGWLTGAAERQLSCPLQGQLSDRANSKAVRPSRQRPMLQRMCLSAGADDDRWKMRVAALRRSG